MIFIFINCRVPRQLNRGTKGGIYYNCVHDDEYVTPMLQVRYEVRVFITTINSVCEWRKEKEKKCNNTSMRISGVGSMAALFRLHYRIVFIPAATHLKCLTST